MLNVYQDLTNKMVSVQDGMIFVIKINCVHVLLKNLNFQRYKHFINNLHHQISVKVGGNVCHITYDIFVIIVESDVRKIISEIIHDYIFDQEVYFSVSTECVSFNKDINKDVEELVYNVLHEMSLAQCDEYLLEQSYSLYVMIHRKKLSIALQPILDVQGNILCHECLLRVDEQKFDNTTDVINVAEQTNLIRDLDMQILNIAIKAIKDNAQLVLSINISYNSIADAHWQKRFVKTIREAGVIKSLIVEITETGSKYNYTTIARFIDNMYDMGVKVAIDDFGSGCTSFQQLKSFKVDLIKIDGLFVRNIIHDVASMLFVESITSMAHSLGIKVIAESVENKQVMSLLQGCKVDYFQGYYLGKPCNI